MATATTASPAEKLAHLKTQMFASTFAAATAARNAGFTRYTIEPRHWPRRPRIVSHYVIVDAGEAEPVTLERRFSLPELIERYESGELEPDEAIAFFQHLIDSGLAWQLQGSYGRTAAELIEQGLCTPGGAR